MKKNLSLQKEIYFQILLLIRSPYQKAMPFTLFLVLLTLYTINENTKKHFWSSTSWSSIGL